MIAPRQTMFYAGRRIVGDRPDSARIPMQDECKRCGQPVTDRGKGKAFRYCQACREARADPTRKARPAATVKTEPKLCRQCGEAIDPERGKGGTPYRYCQACREWRKTATRTERYPRRYPLPDAPTEWDLPWLLRWQWEHTGRTTA